MTPLWYNSPKEIGPARLACVREGRSYDEIRDNILRARKLKRSSANISTTAFWILCRDWQSINQGNEDH